MAGVDKGERFGIHVDLIALFLRALRLASQYQFADSLEPE